LQNIKFKENKIYHSFRKTNNTNNCGVYFSSYKITEGKDFDIAIESTVQNEIF